MLRISQEYKIYCAEGDVSLLGKINLQPMTGRAMYLPVLGDVLSRFYHL